MTIKIAMIAGEASGDQLGAAIITSMKQQADIQIVAGVGGPLMQAQGLQPLFDYTELSIMGIVEILKHLPDMIKRVNQTAAAIAAAQPDIVVSIDCPEFSKPVVKKLRRLCPHTRFVHVVAPTVWAWRPGRARVFARIFDRLLCLFPFEPPYFTAVGLNADFIGHPACDTLPPKTLSPQPRHMLILPGSRRQEVRTMLPIFMAAMQKEWVDTMQFEILTLPHLIPMIEDIMVEYDVPHTITTDKAQAMARADLAMAASGTIGLELALSGIPHLVAYRVNALSAFIGRLLIRTPFVHLANIILREGVVPELIQARATPMDISLVMDGLMADPTLRQAQSDAFARVRTVLQTSEKPADHAARLIVSEAMVKGNIDRLGITAH